MIITFFNRVAIRESKDKEILEYRSEGASILLFLHFKLKE